jgi:hypothetical protein
MHFRFHFHFPRLRKCILHVILITVRLRNYRGMFLKHEIKAEAQNAGVRFLVSDISLVVSFISDRSGGDACVQSSNFTRVIGKIHGSKNIYGNCDVKL